MRGYAVVATLLVVAAGGWWAWRAHSQRSAAVETPGQDDLDLALRRVLNVPSDPTAWAALGDARAAIDELAGAEHAYETAIRLGATDGRAHARLGFLLYQRGAFRRALALLSAARDVGVEMPMLDYTIAELQRELAAPRPVAVAPSDAGVMDASPFDASVVPSEEPAPRVCAIALLRSDERRTFRVPVAFEGVVGELILDTGASMTVLTADFAAQAGVEVDHARGIRAVTANGRTVFSSGHVRVASLGGRDLAGVSVAVCNDCGLGEVSDGLLGLDLMAAWGVEPRLSAAELRFSDCE